MNGNAQLHSSARTKVHSRLPKRCGASSEPIPGKAPALSNQVNHRASRIFAEGTHQAPGLAISPPDARTESGAFQVFLVLRPFWLRIKTPTLAAKHAIRMACAIVGKAAVALQFDPVVKTAF